MRWPYSLAYWIVCILRQMHSFAFFLHATFVAYNQRDAFTECTYPSAFTHIQHLCRSWNSHAFWSQAALTRIQCGPNSMTVWVHYVCISQDDFSLGTQVRAQHVCSWIHMKSMRIRCAFVRITLQPARHSQCVWGACPCQWPQVWQFL